MPTPASPAVYQLRIRLDRSSPLIWRRLLVTGATTIAELHAIIQVACGWSDSHLHQFVRDGKHDGIAYLGEVSLPTIPIRSAWPISACGPASASPASTKVRKNRHYETQQVLVCLLWDLLPISTNFAKALSTS